MSHIHYRPPFLSFMGVQWSKPTGISLQAHTCKCLIRQHGCGLAHKIYFYAYSRKILIITSLCLQIPLLAVLEQCTSYWQINKMLQLGIHLESQVIFPVNCSMVVPGKHITCQIHNYFTKYQLNNKKILKKLSWLWLVCAITILQALITCFTMHIWRCIRCKPMCPFENQGTSVPWGCEGTLRCSQGAAHKDEAQDFQWAGKGKCYIRLCIASLFLTHGSCALDIQAVFLKHRQSGAVAQCCPWNALCGQVSTGLMHQSHSDICLTSS